ncbi:MAG: hypothetical protein QW500_02955 [Candidatus Micrarchaeia archaeon]
MIIMEKKSADTMQNQQKSEYNQQHMKKKVSAFKKVKVAAVGLMMLGTSVLHGGCEGETDLSNWQVQEDTGQVQQVDAGTVRDHGLPGIDASYEDATVSQDASDTSLDAVQDTGPVCKSPNESRVLLKLSIGGTQEVVEAGSKVKIGNKEYTTSLSANSGDLILTSDTGDVIVIPRGKSEVVNGTGVKLVDQATDKLYFTSRALVSVSAGGDKKRAILGESGTYNLEVGQFKVELKSKGIEPWDVEGNVLVADLKIVAPEYTITKEDVRIGKNGYTVKIGSEELAIVPVEFGNDLYQSAGAPSDLCTRTAVKITMQVDGRQVVVGENSKQGVDKDIVVELGTAFIGSAPNTSVYVTVTVNGNKAEEGVYSVGHAFNVISANGKAHEVKIADIDFVTSQVDKY